MTDNQTDCMELTKLKLSALVLAVAAEAALFALSTQTLSDINKQVDIQALQTSGLNDLLPMLEALRLQGQFRGACTAKIVVRGAAPGLASICRDRKQQLDELYAQVTSRSKMAVLTPQWRELPTPAEGGVRFFEAVTTFNAQLISDIDQIYHDAYLAQDTEIETYAAAGLVIDSLPKLIEVMGVLRGSFSLAMSDDITTERYASITGAALTMLQLTEFRMTAYARRNSDTPLSALFIELSHHCMLAQRTVIQLSKLAKQYAGLAIDSRERGALIDKEFGEASAVIDELSRLAVEITELLNNRLRRELVEAQGQRERALAFVLVLQLLLLGGAAMMLSLISRSERTGKELKYATEQQDRLFRVIAHELRTPAAYLSMLPNRFRAEGLDLAQEVTTTSSHLLHVIDDLQASLQLESEPSILLAPVSLSNLAREAARQVRPLYDSTDIQLTTQLNVGDQRLHLTDAYRLRTILTNLLRNAFYHSGGTRVELSLTVEPQQDGQDRVVFSVDDNGVGIPEDDLSRLVKPFERGLTSAPGTGAGLHIVASWLEAIGGALNYRRSDQGGARFEVELVLSRMAPGEAEYTSVQRIVHALANKHVLLVEDDPLIARLVRGMLQELTLAKVEVARSAEDTLVLITDFEPSLIITDYQLPNMNGADLIRLIRGNGLICPVIALTAASTSGVRDELEDAGANWVLPKPATGDDLIRAIAAVIDPI